MSSSAPITSEWYQELKVQLPSSSAWFNYRKQVECFSLGKKFKLRYLSGGNRTGKTYAGAFELMVHAFQTYPIWWVGAKFKPLRKKDIKAGKKYEFYVIGLSYQALADNIQPTILSFFGVSSAEELKKDKRVKKIKQRDGLIKDIELKNGVFIKFRSAESKKRLQGITADFLWIDEEISDMWLLNELILRTTSTSEVDRKILITATPTLGYTPFVDFLVRKKVPMIRVTWNDIPHLQEEEKATLLELMSESEIEARTAGIPRLGAGLVFKIDYEKFEFDNSIHKLNFKSSRFIKGMSLDLGWNYSAISCFCIDKFDSVKGLEHRNIKRTYLVKSFKFSKQEIHDTCLFLRDLAEDFGTDLVIDTSAFQSDQKDGKKIASIIAKYGFRLIKSSKGKEANILRVKELIQKDAFRCLMNDNELYKEELYRYHRNENGIIVKEHDHIIDSVEYFHSSFHKSLAYKEQIEPFL